MSATTPWLIRAQDPMWRNDHDYPVGSRVIGSNEALYTCRIMSGPNTDVGPINPVDDDGTHWQSLKDSLSKNGPNALTPADIGAVSSTGNSVAPAATKLETKRTIAGVEFDGTGNITWFGTCSTAAATAAKVVALTGFKLVTGAEVTVKFTVTNTASNPTLNVNGTGAKAIRYNNAAISASSLQANKVFRFAFDGTYWQFVGYIDSNTDTKVTQTVTTTNDEYPLLMTNTADATATRTEGARFGTKITANPSTGAITATSFKGAVTGTASAASKLATARTISLTGDATGSASFDGSANASIKTTIANMKGATADAAGADGFVPAPAAGAQGKFLRGDGTWQTPTNTDTKVTQTVTTTNAEYPLLATSLAKATANRTEGVRFASAVTLNPSTQRITAKGVKAPANGTTYVSTAAANGAVIDTNVAAGTYFGLMRYPSKNGVFTQYGYSSELGWKYFTNAQVSEAENSSTESLIWSESGVLSSTGGFKGSLDGNASSATKLATARTIRTNLASTSTASFNGTANVTPGVTGILPVANGGTGNSTGKATDSTKWNGASKTVSTAAPSGGANGDIWFQYIA